MESIYVCGQYISYIPYRTREYISYLLWVSTGRYVEYYRYTHTYTHIEHVCTIHTRRKGMQRKVCKAR